MEVHERMIKRLVYQVSDIRPYINWLYFYHTWSMNGKPKEEKEKLRVEAETMLDEFETRYKTYAVFGIFDANSDEDDILIGDVRLPLLRQQRAKDNCSPHLCLSDFLRPLSSCIKDKVGAFATTVDTGMEFDYKHDDFRQMMAKVLAERLAEGTAEKMHEDVRRTYWGYAPDEHFTPEELHREMYQGIRPAIGYPSLPDTSVNFILNELIGMSRIGIHLTETGMMQPHASVSGLMFAHPRAKYFDLGKIGEDQLRDYALRRRIPVEMMRKFLASSVVCNR